MNSRYGKYGEYRDSGVVHLGAVPEHWETKQMKRSVDGVTNGIWGGDATGGDDDLVVLRVADFDRPRLGLKDEDYTTRAVSRSERQRRLLRPGDLLLEKSGGGEKTQVGQVVLFDKPIEAVCSNFVSKMTPLDGYESSYLNYSFSALYDAGVNYCSIKQNTGIQNLDSSRYLAEQWAFPTLAEQGQVAKFLDHETAKIDTLIEKQEQLIALLEEKRQAVISHAVTKGLNPDAPMRDSGVEWLGEIPAHWNSPPLKHSVVCFEQGWSPQCDQYPAGEGEWGVLKVGCVNSGQFNRRENKRLPEGVVPREEYVLKAGDLLISRANTLDLVGSAAVVREDEPNLLLCDKLYRLRFDATVDVQFVSYFLGTTIARQRIELAATGASYSMQNIGQGTIQNLPFPKPPRSEAREIVAALECKLAKLDLSVARAGAMVELLKERRSTLISAAVTGKIDVRDWTPPDAPNEGSGEAA